VDHVDPGMPRQELDRGRELHGGGPCRSDVVRPSRLRYAKHLRMTDVFDAIDNTTSS
jgi:hypothetical protein